MSGGDDAVKAKDLLQRAANQSHGKFYTTSGAGGLADAFANILNEVLAKTSSFVAPIVPVSKMERTTAGDKIYLAFFKPNQSGMWSGNIKKYGVQQSNSGSLVIGDILDASGSKALDSSGEFYPSSKSFWTTSTSDGGEVEVGGVGEVLKNRSSARNIYTLLRHSLNPARWVAGLLRGPAQPNVLGILSPLFPRTRTSMIIGCFALVEPFTPVRRQFQLIREMGIDYVDLTDSHDGASLGSEAGFVASLSLDSHPAKIRRLVEEFGLT